LLNFFVNHAIQLKTVSPHTTVENNLTVLFLLRSYELVKAERKRTQECWICRCRCWGEYRHTLCNQTKPIVTSTATDHAKFFAVKLMMLMLQLKGEFCE